MGIGPARHRGTADFRDPESKIDRRKEPVDLKYGAKGSSVKTVEGLIPIA